MFFVVLAVALTLRLTFFAISVMNVPPSSDESIAMLQAGNIISGRFPLLFMAQPYMFPIESYIIAPFVSILPANAFGARLIPALMCLTAVAVSLFIVKKNASILTPWVAVLMILFPSSYIVMLQSAYALPGYSALPFMGMTGVILAVYQRERSSVILAFLAGLVSALGFSTSMLALPFGIFTGGYVCLGINRRSVLRNGAPFLAGCMIGVLPFLIAKLTIPGAYVAVTSRRSIMEAVKWLWSPTMTHALSPVFGPRICSFPDGASSSILSLPPELFGAIFAAIFLIVTGMRIYALRRVVTEKWLRLELPDMFIGIVLFTLVAFTLGKRADSCSYRYLIICAWSFPFVVAYLHRSAWPLFRYVLSALVIFLTGLNIISTVVLANKWRAPDFSASVGLADLNPVLRRLDEMGIKHCVASYGVSYRINYQSGGRIISSQPTNERFSGWPIPYKEIVDKENDVAYVLTDTVRFLKPDIFDRHLRTMKVESLKESCGKFFLYHNFRAMSVFKFLPVSDLAFSASHNSGDASLMNDGSSDTIWTSIVPQEEKMWIQIDLPSADNVCGIQFNYGNYEHDIAVRTDVNLLTETGWVTAVTNLENTCGKFVFQNNHPVYGPARQTILFPAAQVKAIRTTITKARPHFCWTVDEIKVLTGLDDAVK